MSGKAALAGVIGDPVAHSLSPALHGAWIEALALDAAYVPLHVKAGQLEQALRALPVLGFRGVNITLPHKEAACQIVDEISDVAQRIGAVNTVKVKEDGSLFGTNTDAEGFWQNLLYQCPQAAASLQQVMVVGAGGASLAILHALREAGAENIFLTNRTRSKAEEVAARFGAIEMVEWDAKEEVLSSLSLLVNTTSLGMDGKEPLALSVETLPTEAIVADIVYQPLMTPLLEQAKEQGNPICTGLGMLVYQAVAGFEMWFGTRPPEELILRTCQQLEERFS